MEYLKKDELYKNRGYAKCISSGYHAMIDNYKSIFSYTWKSALAYFLVLVAAFTTTDGFSIPMSTSGWIIWGVMVAAVTLSHYFLFAHIVNIFTEQGKLFVFKKLLVLFLWAVIITSLILVALSLTVGFSYTSQYRNEIVIGAFALMALLVFIFGVPFGYLAVKYLVEDEKHFCKVVKHNYSKGFSHWGLIFVTFILSFFFVSVASFVVVLPFYILVVAKVSSAAGVMLGDASGMPSYFPFIFALTSSIVSVIILYFNSSIFATLYYTYGSIEQRENERIGFMENSMKI